MKKLTRFRSLLFLLGSLACFGQTDSLVVQKAEQKIHAITDSTKVVCEKWNLIIEKLEKIKAEKELRNR